MGRRLLPGRGADHVRDDAGGVWIITGWVLGGLVYIGVVLAWHAGFTAAAPFVVIPAVLVFMIGGGNLLSGRRSGRPAPQFNRPDPIPITTFRRDAGPLDGPHVPVQQAAPADDGGEDPAPAAEAPGPER
jgi:hypothetical protein